MTATQVFLRFVKSQYTKENGELDADMYKKWMDALSTCTNTKRRTHYWLNNFYEKKQSFWNRRAAGENIKDYVDCILQNGRSLNGFMNFLIREEASWWSINYFMDNLCKAYDKERLSKHDWPRKKEGSQMLIKEWHKFLDEHIEGNINKIWSNNKQYSFTWKE